MDHPPAGSDARETALAALGGLGLSAREARALLRRAEGGRTDLVSAEELVLAALRFT